MATSDFYTEVVRGRVANHRPEFVEVLSAAVIDIPTLSEFIVPSRTFALLVKFFISAKSISSFEGVLEVRPSGGVYASRRSIFIPSFVPDTLTLPLKFSENDGIRLAINDLPNPNDRVSVTFEYILIDDAKSNLTAGLD